MEKEGDGEGASRFSSTLLHNYLDGLVGTELDLYAANSRVTVLAHCLAI